jgi:hypothetical protein
VVGFLGVRGCEWPEAITLDSMKIALPLPCQGCRSREPVLVALDAVWYEWTCAECGTANSILSSLDWTKGKRILERATQYREQGDYATSIVFSAIALEAELARLFFKWRRIDHLREMIAHTRPYEPEPTDEELEVEYRQLGRTIAERIESVCLLLDERGIDEVARQSDLATPIEDDFPSLNLGSLARDLQRAIFERRNRVVHTGYTGHDESDARTAQNCADVAISLLKQMDARRRER